ncbi:PepSY domain-containing protein [Paenalkalicoccus suaedae]|uniref:PepSY domain-containing protein n=1 Tax=Paenalkalicoccus suaedae TaxID=2592382 RepID=A0A859FH02_9BACI|nr:PepSY domain-containing protein [Paenalkalicoccus suaedae]QKS72098.1 PepSY domain-containing protein [Paenalkalicoccus suaedae]
MSWKRFAAGVGAGVAVTMIAKSTLDKSESKLSPEKALKLVKKKANELGTVEGSWVHMITEQHESDHLMYDVYRGGITLAEEDGQVSAYEFYVDAETGTILTFKKQD